jgi:hypothetical protein
MLAAIQQFGRGRVPTLRTRPHLRPTPSIVQRLGVSLSKLSQKELDQRVKDARPTELVRFADQAFGKPIEAEEDTATDDLLAGLTREQRAVMRSWLEDTEDVGPAPE